MTFLKSTKCDKIMFINYTRKYISHHAFVFWFSFQILHDLFVQNNWIYVNEQFICFFVVVYINDKNLIKGLVFTSVMNMNLFIMKDVLNLHLNMRFDLRLVYEMFAKVLNTNIV